MSNKSRLINSGIFSHKNNFGDSRTLDVSDAADKFRAALGSFYTDQSDTLGRLANTTISLPGLLLLLPTGRFFNEEGKEVLDVGPNPAHESFKKIGNYRSADEYNKKQFRDLFNLQRPLPLAGSDSNLAENNSPLIRERVEYEDDVFTLDLPMLKKDLDRLNLPAGLSFIDIQPVYNFFINSYEKVSSREEVPETLLPNIYAFLTEKRSENLDRHNTVFKQHITLNGKIPDVFIDVVSNNGEKIGERDEGQYFDKFARTLHLMGLDLSSVEFLKDRFSNLAVPISNIDLFKIFNEKKELFPMFFDISFSTDNRTQFAQILKDSNLSSILIKDIVSENIMQDETSVVVTKRIRIKGEFINSVETKSFRSWDIMNWKDTLLADPISSFESLNERGVFLGTFNKEMELADNPQFDLYKSLLVYIFSGKLQTLIENKSRTFRDILVGKEAYSENAFYSIQKIDASTNEILQTFYLPNSNEIDILRFIDTQVKYNKSYRYVLNVFQFVIGNKYSYSIEQLSDAAASIEIDNVPTVKLIEIPLYEFEGRIMDSPPIFPDVNFIPYRAVNNKVLFSLNSNTGRYMLEPIIIEDSDIEIINHLREAQRADEEEFLKYESDDHAMAFEIFRISNRPRSYQDFSGKRIALVETDIDTLTPQKATAAAFIDDVIPNKKYYYTFRAIDNHGHISNPTSVYEFEMVDDNGSIYPIVKIVDFNLNSDLKRSSKEGKRFIQIMPVFNQVAINEEQSGIIVNENRIPSVLGKQDFHLGFANESIWNKKFKIRLVSNKTGKKIDFDIQFDKEHVNKE